MNRYFSITRFLAIIIKEFIQMRRDRVTFGMMVGIPLLQLLLFGFAINSDPKHLPAAVLMNDQGPQARTLLSAIRNSGYYEFVRQVKSEAEAREVLEHGEVQAALPTWGRYLALSKEVLKQQGKRGLFDLGNAEIILPAAATLRAPLRHRAMPRMVGRTTTRRSCGRRGWPPGPCRRRARRRWPHRWWSVRRRPSQARERPAAM